MGGGKVSIKPKPRELTATERGEIKLLVTKLCANYHREYGCLPLESACYMLGKWWTGAFCKYFQNAVLPLNPALEADLTGDGQNIPHKLCPVCGAVYIPTTSQVYCSTKCRTIGLREGCRRRQRKRRSKGRG